MLKRDSALIATIIGILKAGCTFVPLDLEYPAERIQYIYENSQADYIITEDESTDVSLNINELLKEDNAENLALKDSFKSLEEVPDYNTAFMNLETGLVDAIAVDIGVAQYQLNNRKGKFRILDEELSKEQYAVGFRQGNIKLREQVEETLFEMYKDGTVMKIAQNYADFNLPDMICLGNYVK